MTTKPCSICGQRLPLTAYHLDKNKADGRRGSCAACTNERGKQRRRGLVAQGSERSPKFAGYPKCVVCLIVMLPDGDALNRPWAGDGSMCRYCGERGKVAEVIQ